MCNILLSMTMTSKQAGKQASKQAGKQASKQSIMTVHNEAMYIT